MHAFRKAKLFISFKISLYYLLIELQRVRLSLAKALRFIVKVPSAFVTCLLIVKVLLEFLF